MNKNEWKLHEQAIDLLENGKELTTEQIHFVYDNWRPDATSRVDKNGAYFTPWGLAYALAQDSGYQGRIVDLCAGTGILLWAIMVRNGNGAGRPSLEGLDLTAIELNPDYVEVGKRLLPEVNWICGSVFDQDIWNEIGHFDHAVSNPPFGNIMPKPEGLKYRGTLVELMVAELAFTHADSVVVILPQESTPPAVRMTGPDVSFNREKPPSRQVQRFLNVMKVAEFNTSNYDTTCHRDEWKGVKPVTELVSLDRVWRG